MIARYRIPLYLMMALAIGFLLGGRLGGDGGAYAVRPAPREKAQPIDEILNYIEHHYVDDVDLRHITDAAIRMVMDSLDEHSRYLSADEVENYRMRMSGKYVGLGIHFRMIRDTPVVTHVYGESPAASAGLEVGDQLLYVDSQSLVSDSLSYKEIATQLKGHDGGQVTCLTSRCGDTSSVRINRGQVYTPSVSSPILLDDGVYYIAVQHFNQHTSTEFLDALEPAQEEGSLRDLVLDLRGNPGGYLDEAIKMLNQFVDEKGQLLLYTEGVSSERKEYKAMGKSYLQIDNVVVLMDHNSASASEIVAGAIQDLDRGVVIGRRSYGKGLVQEQYPLSSGGALKLTVARYYTPSGRLIQSVPSLHGQDDQASDEWGTRWHRGELCHPLSIPLVDSLAYCSKDGHERYGGRGIVPDFFVPIDSLDLLWVEQPELWDEIELLGYDIARDLTCTDMDMDVGSLIRSHIDSMSTDVEWTLGMQEYQGLQAELPTLIMAVVDRYREGHATWFERMIPLDDDVDAAIAYLKRMNSTQLKTNSYAER